MKKRCNACKKTKDCSEFWKNKIREDGLQVSCRSCLGKANRRVRTRKRQAVYGYLQKHPCVDCGEADPLVLEFDHVRGTKILGISQLVSNSVSMSKIVEEMAKCEVRCGNCHIRETIRRSGQMPWTAEFEVPGKLLKQLEKLETR